MYTITRQEAADVLNISTRSIDRYIKNGKLRSKKDWKVVYVNNSDVENMKTWNTKVHEVIMPEKEEVKESVKITRNVDNWPTLESIYIDLRKQIIEKDNTIQELSIRLWRAEEIAKNSISVIDFKKSQFMLEESKTHLSSALNDLKREKDKLEKNMKNEKVTNIVLLLFVFLFFIISCILWFGNI